MPMLSVMPCVIAIDHAPHSVIAVASSSQHQLSSTSLVPTAKSRPTSTTPLHNMLGNIIACLPDNSKQ